MRPGESTRRGSGLAHLERAAAAAEELAAKVAKAKLVSSDRTLQVRQARRDNMRCGGTGSGPHGRLRSPLCPVHITRGQVYVARVEGYWTRGDFAWVKDLGRYCVHCARIRFAGYLREEQSK